MLTLNDLRLEDLHWIAGFLEGEGCFGRCGGTVHVTASQVEKDPIDKLHNLLGGNVIYIRRDHPKQSNHYRWSAYGETAELIMKAVFPIMSTKRKNKISETLAWYASRPGRNFVKSGRKTCRKGLHQWNDENTYVDSRVMRTCRLCERASGKIRRDRKRELKLR